MERRLSTFVDCSGLMIVALTLSFFLCLHVIDGSWEGFVQSTCLSPGHSCFCERPRDGLVRQPSNTYSNLAFTICGAAALSRGYRALATSKRKVSGKSPREGATASGEALRTAIGVNALSYTSAEEARDKVGEAFIIVFVLSCVILGFGSGLFHASLTFFGQILDNAGMYVVAGACAVYSFASVRLVRASPNSFLLPHHRLYVDWLLWTCVTVAVKVWLHMADIAGNLFGNFYFFFLIAFAFFSEVYARRVCYLRSEKGKLRYFFAATITFAVSFAVWLLDKKGVICYPDSVFQGHAVWHILDGFAAYFLFLYYLPIAIEAEKKKEIKGPGRLIGINCGIGLRYEIV